jgi:hypothetical protein
VLLTVVAFAFLYNLVIALKRAKTQKYANQEIVVARYNEPLSWIADAPFNRHPIIVYNKGDNDNFVKSDNIKATVKLPNVGREMHSYFHHIIENYDKLADMTIFLPGSVELPNKFNRSVKLVEAVENNNKTTFSCFRDEKFVEQNYDFTINSYASSHGNNREVNKDDRMKKSDIRPYGKWFSAIFKNGEKNDYISYNSIIAISRDNILQKPKSYYEMLIKQVDDHQNPETVHYLERSWYAVFYPYKDAKFIY